MTKKESKTTKANEELKEALKAFKPEEKYIRPDFLPKDLDAQITTITVSHEVAEKLKAKDVSVAFIDEPQLTEDDLPKLQAWYDTVIKPAKNQGLSVIVPATLPKP